MSFIDSLTGHKITATCMMCGHEEHEVEKGLVYYEYKKKNAEGDGVIKRFYFVGKVTYCGRWRCDWEKFEGSKIPVRITKIKNGVEREVGQ